MFLLRRRNIVLTGGNALFPGFRERLERDVRSLAPHLMEVVVRVGGGGLEPHLYPWRGGASLAADPALATLCVSKEEYMEKGYSACQQKYFL
jgi:actin-related protein 6